MKKFVLLFIVWLFGATSIVQAQSNLIAGKTAGAPINTNPAVSSAACDTIFSFPARDTWPSGIAYDGTYLWSNGYDIAYIYKHSLTGTVIDSIPSPSFFSLGYMGGDLDFDGTNLLFFQEESDTLYKIDPTTGNVTSRFRISACGTNCYGVAFDGTYIWISNYSPQALYKVNATTGAVLNSFPLSTSSNMLPIEFINGKLYGLGVFPGVVYEIDTTSGSVNSSIPWCLGYSLGFCIADNHLWGSSSQVSTGGTKRIYQFDSLLLSNPTLPSYIDNNFEMYPNPAQHSVTIEFNNLIKKGDVELFNLLGERIFINEISDEKSFTINVEKFKSGIYLVKIFDGKKIINKKLIVGSF